MKTNAQVRRDVIAELSSEPLVSAAHIDVEAKDGIVTLTGQVNSYANKWDAESAAQRVSGVKGLVVKMDVALSGSSNRNDANFARSAEGILQWTDRPAIFGQNGNPVLV
jgi:hypothetical protein